MAETWLKCSSCRTDIPHGGMYFQCSVSTCNRPRTRLVFCSVACWDSHLGEARHRDAGAVEARAPAKDAWERELAAMGPAPAPAAPAPAPRPIPAGAPAPAFRPMASGSQAQVNPNRRVVGDASPSTAAAVEGNIHLNDIVDSEILIVVSKLKKYIKDRSGMNCSDAVAEVLSDHVRALCDDSIRAAARDERKTVLDRDVPRPRR